LVLVRVLANFDHQRSSDQGVGSYVICMCGLVTIRLTCLSGLLGTGYIPGTAARRWACLADDGRLQGMKYEPGREPGLGHKLGLTIFEGFLIRIVEGEWSTKSVVKSMRQQRDMSQGPTKCTLYYGSSCAQARDRNAARKLLSFHQSNTGI
jgi:hypothetical protein